MPLSPISLLRGNLKRFKRHLVYGNIACMIIVVLAAALATKSSYDSHQDRARQASIAMAQALSQDIGESFAQIDHTLLSTLRQVDRMEAHGPLSARELSAVTEEQRALVPSMTALRLTDAEGWVLNPGDKPSVSVGDRDYFRAAKAQPARLAVSDPLKGRINKAGWGVILARARVSADGRFQGVIYGGITTSKFHEQFQRVSVGAHGSVALRTAELKLIARYSPIELDKNAGVGTSKVSKALQDAVAADPTHGSFHTRTALDDIERITAYQQLPGYPMMLVVGLATNDFLQPWWRQLWVIGSFALLLESLVLSFSFALFRAQQRQEQAGEQIVHLALERGVLLDNELVGMAKLRNRQVVWHNRALAQVFGYGPGELNMASTRLLYLDDESYARVGEGHANLTVGSTFRTQLQMARKDGSSIWIELSGAALEGGESLWLIVDINVVKLSEEQARFLAFHDPLTGLPNRHLLAERLEFLLSDAARRQACVGVCYLDLDGFKAVNDHYGHDAGDELLRIAALRMNGSVRANDVVARIGGDEFVVVVSQSDTVDGIEQALSRLLDAFEPPFVLSNGIEVIVGVSIGVAVYPRHAQRVADLITLADQAMLAGKRTCKGRWVMHESTIHEPANVS
jgi:diguanylate cyclase (GGDEF)-like protein/PAS domain S-box-containing protein